MQIFDTFFKKTCFELGELLMKVTDITNSLNKDESKEEGVLEEIANPPVPEMPSEAIQIVFVSMWYWWQEIVLISLVTAAVMNLLITRPYIQGMREGFRRRIDQITRGRPVSPFLTANNNLAFQ